MPAWLDGALVGLVLVGALGYLRRRGARQRRGCGSCAAALPAQPASKLP